MPYISGMKTILAIFVGGGLGSLARFGLGRWVTSWHSYHFPFSTLTVNLVACLALGFIVGLADHRQLLSPTSKLFWAVGFCGGFSTFSTFSHESLTLYQEGHLSSMLLYVGGSVVVGLAATVVGFWLGNRI